MLIQTGAIEGYGGVVIQACQVKGEDVTVLYGHLDYNAFQKKAGDQVSRGEELGVLGDAKSAETGQTRKHLHFGVHKGTEIEMRGYVQQKSELDQFIDPLTLLQ